MCYVTLSSPYHHRLIIILFITFPSRYPRFQVIQAFTTDPDRYLDVLAVRSVLLKVFRDADEFGQGTLIAEQFKGALTKFDKRLTNVMNKLGSKEVSPHLGLLLVSIIHPDDHPMSSL